MSRSVTAPYRVEYGCASSVTVSPACWFVSKHGQTPAKGQPTNARLAEHVAALNVSFAPGGINAHCGPTVIVRARVVRQRDGVEVATWAAPAFTGVVHGVHVPRTLSA